MKIVIREDEIVQVSAKLSIIYFCRGGHYGYDENYVDYPETRYGDLESNIQEKMKEYVEKDATVKGHTLGDYCLRIAIQVTLGTSGEYSVFLHSEHILRPWNDPKHEAASEMELNGGQEEGEVIGVEATIRMPDQKPVTTTLVPKKNGPTVH
jgi:hypothetical protein